VFYLPNRQISPFHGIGDIQAILLAHIKADESSLLLKTFVFGQRETLYLRSHSYASMNVLFICNQNKNRSKTAEELFKDRFKTRSAGLYNEKPVNEKQISWADTIIVMEDAHRNEISKRFPKQYMLKRILSLDIPDIYRYNQPELVDILNSKMNDFIREPRAPA
jgi:predicted protein tyrosine phosphatase